MPFVSSTARNLLTFLMVLSLTAACTPVPDSSAPPDVILISLDTLRRDQVGTYDGGTASSTPNLDALAASGVVFENAFAPVPFTLPSHMSMLTGLDPGVHAVQGAKARLSPRVSTLAESLSVAGYRSLALVSNLWMKGVFGFSRGFEHYERVDYDLMYSERINQRLFELLDGRPGDSRPIFLFLHYIDPHSDFFRVGNNTLPYYAPAEFLEDTGVAPDSREFCDEAGNCATDYLLAVNREGRPVSDSELQRVRALYRSGVEYLDRDLGRLFDGLRERGLWEGSLIIVTADHGEEFLEHGEFVHSQPYVENLAVPLMFRLPDGSHSGSRLQDVVELRDLLPTILELLGVPVPASVQGRSLMPLLTGGRLPPGTALGRDKKNRQRFTLRTGNYSLVHDFGSDRSELFDRRADPAEQTDISAREPDAVARLQSGLEARLAENQRMAAELEAAQQADDLLSEDERDKLRAIGYLD